VLVDLARLTLADQELALGPRGSGENVIRLDHRGDMADAYTTVWTLGGISRWWWKNTACPKESLSAIA
jgi:hypothetical protein